MQSIIESLPERHQSFLEKTKLSKEYAEVYNEFGKEYKECKEPNEIKSIKNGSLTLYAIDNIVEIKDYTEKFKQIEDAYNAFKSICERPKSHLKSINEVRPIETIKRIGYEAIPYLAAHSEDWLARTASGLKPARLFSRVEEDDFQIYENRVVKTLLDLLISFLSRVERELRYHKEQLSSIMNENVHATGFGFDKKFSIAIAELIKDDYSNNEKELEKLLKLEELHSKSLELLKKYRTLRDTKLYQLIKKAKSVQNPLNETNILLLDKHYSVIYKLWKKLHRILIYKSVKVKNQIEENKLSLYYQQFVATLCGYATHALSFDWISKGKYKRDSDNIEVVIEQLGNGSIRVSLTEKEKRSVFTNGMPIPDTSSSRFEYNDNDKILTFPDDITSEEIDEYCSQLKIKGIVKNVKEKEKASKQYLELKKLIQKELTCCQDSIKTSFVIVPYFIELSLDTISPFYDSVTDIKNKYFNQNQDNEIIIALPLCNEYEQKVIKYAQDDCSDISILPITMFDINSFRRIQKILYTYILKFNKRKCLVCGGELRKKEENQYICDDCRLILIETKCSKCKKEYYYQHFDYTADNISKMALVQQDNFFQWDSLWQYKNIVSMKVDTKIDKKTIRPVCPECHYSKE